MSRLQQQAIVIGDSFNNTLGLIRSLGEAKVDIVLLLVGDCLLYTSPSPRDLSTSRMPSSA